MLRRSCFIIPRTIAAYNKVNLPQRLDIPKFSSRGFRNIPQLHLNWFGRRMGDSQSIQCDLPETNSVERKDKVRLTEEEWKKKLSSEQFQVCRRKGTQRAWEGELLDNKQKGIYSCAACGFDLFSSSTKFDSGSGWPSFFDVIKDKTTNVSNVEVKTDSGHGMTRTEVLCGKCDSHLGHVFNDGPQPTGLRFCINSVSMTFRKEERDGATTAGSGKSSM